MTRLAALLVMVTAMACAGRAHASPPSAPRVPRSERVLVIAPRTTVAERVVGVLMSELDGELEVEVLNVDDDSTPLDLARALDRARPVALLLLNNGSVRLYQALQDALPSAQPLPPAVVALAAYADDAARALRNATGVRYEVPLVTQLVRLRELVQEPVSRVGVIHRRALAAHVKAQAELAARERFEVCAVVVSDRPTVRELRAALAELRERGVDAVAVMNDNRLLEPELLSDAWLPGVRRMNVPVLVGVRSLLDPRVAFGTFAMLPDHEGLGVQLATLILELRDGGWSAAGRRLDLPVSLRTVIDAAAAEETVHLVPSAWGRVDEVLR